MRDYIRSILDTEVNDYWTLGQAMWGFVILLLLAVLFWFVIVLFA
jgi:hypothetical protein